jgi:hypothetical protein
MIGVIFSFGTEIIEVRVNDKSVYFRNSASPNFGSIDTLKLDKSGVIKEFPDLKDKDNWASEARGRFREKINDLKTEEARIKYIIDDLSKFGYKPMYMQKQGFRPRKI